MVARNTVQYLKYQALFAVCMVLLCNVPHAWAEPPGTARSAERANSSVRRAKPHLFGTVAFRRPLEKQKNWISVLQRNAESPIFEDKKRLSRSITWEELKEKTQDRPFKEMLDVVNRFWNSWPYRLDKEVWGKDDYWATPAEFLSRSGDCEDYCIAKYFTLRELGVPADDMRIVVVRETVRGVAHAVLAVYEGQQVHILDNLVEHVRPMRRVRNYQPYFSVNENGCWMHVKAKPSKEGKAMENGHGTER
ncbi:MAG: transglutaminase-like cysteine peptidase [Mailhella sp.]|nr:transglutaminase-like cysteine peptidase [Mailhella sp.]